MIQKIKKIIALALYHLKLLAFFQWLRVRLFKRPCITILCYHRVVEQGALLSPQCIPPKAFDEQLLHFTSHYNVWTLDDVYDYLSGRIQLKNDAVVLTFDDGYEDNYSNAYPILSKHHLKACFFIASNPIIYRKSYWIDELSGLLEFAYTSKDVVEIPEFPKLQQTISTFVNSRPGFKKTVAKEIFMLVYALNEDDKMKALDALRDRYSRDPLSKVNEPALMSVSQVEELISVGHHIGAHTVSHPRLINLSGRELTHEIVEGIKRLRERFSEVHYFAYPFGKLTDIPVEKKELNLILKSNGIKLAVTTEDNVVASDDHLYLVPRKVISPQSVPQIQLKMELLAWKRKKAVSQN